MKIEHSEIRLWRKLFLLLPVMLNLFQHPSFSQQSKIDSSPRGRVSPSADLSLRLAKSLHACPEPCIGDTDRVNTLNALGWELMYSNPDTAIILGNQALVIAENPHAKAWG